MLRCWGLEGLLPWAMLSCQEEQTLEVTGWHLDFFLAKRNL